MKNDLIRDILYVVLFAAVFFLLQFITEVAGAAIYAFGHGMSVDSVLKAMAMGRYSELLTVTVVFSSLLTIALYGALKWAPVSRSYLRSKPWGVVCWIVFLALGSVLPLEWVYERIALTMPEGLAQLFDGVMKQPWGYAAIGLLVPVAEEMVFRGAILRRLISIFGDRWHWAAIAVSALIFGAMHGNLAQGLHAFIIGLILGWMYYRTKSIVPTVVFHWVNNTVAFVMFHMMPQMNDGKLIDLFHGNHTTMMLSLLFSLCIFLPALFQLTNRLKRAE